MTDIRQLRGTPHPPPLPRTALTAQQQIRDSAIGHAAGIVAAVGAADARERDGLDWDELGTQALEMARRFEPYVRDGSAPAVSGWDPTSPQWAVIRKAIRFRLDPSDENRKALFAATDELPHIGETQEAS